MGATETKQAEAPRKGPRVIVNVYVPQQQQQQMSLPGFGVYHSGVQIHNTEYTFAGGAGISGSGVQEQTPKASPPGSQWQYSESVDLGPTNLTDLEVKSVISRLRDEFTASSYDLVNRNCNHFCEILCTRLNVQYPSWVNRMAKLGNTFRGGSDPVEAEKRRIEHDKRARAEQEKIKNVLLQKQGSLPPEPPLQEGVYEIQVNCPAGAKAKRRFLPTNTLKDVADFAEAYDQTLTRGTFNFRTNYPKRVLSDFKQTLLAAGIAPKENLFVEIKRA